MKKENSEAEELDDFAKNVLVPFFKNYNPEEAKQEVIEGKIRFEQKLNGELKKEFLELWKKTERYVAIVSNRSFSKGFERGLSYGPLKK